MTERKDYVLWKCTNEVKKLVSIYASKSKAIREADNLRRELIESDMDDDSIEYFVEGIEVK